MFRHPGQFMRLGMPIRRWAMDVEPRSLREVHGFITAPNDSEPQESEPPKGGPVRDDKID